MTIEGAREFESLVRAALDEDAVSRDHTTASTIDADATAGADVVFRSGGVLAGLPVAALAMQLVDPRIDFPIPRSDGSVVEPGAAVARVTGSARALLSAERVALNFLARLSGIATLTRTFVDAINDFSTIIADTRKTTPGLRVLERYAVRAGGGCNHRFDLSSAVLIKDNHLASGISVGDAVRRALAGSPPDTIVEVECDTLSQVRDAVEAGADAVLLDNMPVADMTTAVKVAKGRSALEASGGVTLANIRSIAETGVEVISIGALTHGARWLDVALDFERPARHGR